MDVSVRLHHFSLVTAHMRRLSSWDVDHDINHGTIINRHSDTGVQRRLHIDNGRFLIISPSEERLVIDFPDSVVGLRHVPQDGAVRCGDRRYGRKWR